MVNSYAFAWLDSTPANKKLTTLDLDLARAFIGISKGNQMLGAYVTALQFDLTSLLDWKLNRSEFDRKIVPDDLSSNGVKAAGNFNTLVNMLRRLSQSIDILCVITAGQVRRSSKTGASVDNSAIIASATEKEDLITAKFPDNDDNSESGDD